MLRFTLLLVFTSATFVDRGDDYCAFGKCIGDLNENERNDTKLVKIFTSSMPDAFGSRTTGFRSKIGNVKAFEMFRYGSNRLVVGIKVNFDADESEFFGA